MIDNIQAELRELQIPEHKINNIITLIKSSIPKEDILPALPDMLHTGLDYIDFMLAPIKNNSRVHIYGRPGSGKTAIITKIAASIVQEYNTKLLWLDSTFRLDTNFFKRFFKDEIEFYQSSTISEEITESITNGEYRVIVVDDIATYMRESIAELERIFHFCKINKILVLLANQVRVVPKTGKIYAPKQELETNYDIVLQIKKHSVHYEDGYNDFSIKVEYYKQCGLLEKKSIILPLQTNGSVRADLMEKRMAKMLKAEGFDEFESYMKHRETLLRI